MYNRIHTDEFFLNTLTYVCFRERKHKKVKGITYITCYHSENETDRERELVREVWREIYPGVNIRNGCPGSCGDDKGERTEFSNTL